MTARWQGEKEKLGSAQKIKEELEAARLAYDRGDFLEERRKLMTWWADECDKMRLGADVILLNNVA